MDKMSGQLKQPLAVLYSNHLRGAFLLFLFELRFGGAIFRFDNIQYHTLSKYIENF